MKKIIVLLLSLVCFSVKASELAEYSKSAILLETTTGKVLYEKNADEKMAPASTTKLMGMLLIMEAIDNGVLSLDDDVYISKTAASMGGSQVFLEENSNMKVNELIKAIAISSGNDAMVAMAEKIGGTVSAFVDMMNNKAQELGLKNTTFKNPHGLDTDDHLSTARDLSIISLELLKHEKILDFTSIYEDYLKKPDGKSTWLVNTNKLVRFFDGVDGLKTGYTANAGYCLSATAKRNDIRFIAVVMNADSSEHRSSDIVNMLNYGFNTYKLSTIIKKNEVINNVKINNGVVLNTDIVLKEDATELLNINSSNKDYKYEVNISDINAPIKKGDKVGSVKILNSAGEFIKEVDLTVKEDIKKASIWLLFKRNIVEMLYSKY